MKIKNYKIGDEVKILDLFEVVFRQKLKLENWLWRFRENPAGKHLIKLMWDDDELIGHYAVSPLFMNVEGVDVLTALSLTTMTHPDYQGKGIFSKLSMALYNDLEQNYNCKAIWGFPNNNSHYGFVKKLEWKNLVMIHTLTLDLKVLEPKGIEYSSKLITRFNTSQEKIISENIKRFSSIFVKHSVAYLNWRFIDKPNSQYKCYEFNSNLYNSIIVVKPYNIKNSNKYILNIISCFADNYAYIHDYIAHILNDFDFEFEKVTIWKSLWSSDHLSLEKQNFIPELPQTYLATRVHESMPKSFSDFRNWHISMSDSDVF
jgi:GNAT superfamily N-acetyltransferase